MRKTNNATNGQQGFVSLVVALTLVIILALITVGFAQLSRREQQQAIDKQLSVQAYYAAESGINDAYKDATTHVDGTGTPYINLANASHTTCMTTATGLSPLAFSAHSDVNLTTGASYSCLLVNLRPPSIQESDVGPNTDRTITSSIFNAPSQLTINWGSSDGASGFSNNSALTKLPPAGSWGPWPAVLQFSITPLNAPFDRNSLINNTFTAYLYPSSKPGIQPAYVAGISNSNLNGPIVEGGCNPAFNSVKYPCSVTITGLAAVGGTGPYVIHVIDYYDSSNISISGKDSLGNPVTFDGQIQIDVTGKSQDVLKRLQVHVPLKASPDFPADALEGQNICKQFYTYPGLATPSAIAGCSLN